MTKLIVPEWPLPIFCSSTRIGGVSQDAWESLNLGAHCGVDHVDENRKRMFAAGHLPQNRFGLSRCMALTY
ncbi:multi-copper polyphenol oxidoreductase, laccase [Lelliottia amnigena]|nr:multi-copper polyphenol oxidoreductase, laccase [Lelliottia amnigena]